MEDSQLNRNASGSSDSRPESQVRAHLRESASGLDLHSQTTTFSDGCHGSLGFEGAGLGMGSGDERQEADGDQGRDSDCKVRPHTLRFPLSCSRRFCKPQSSPPQNAQSGGAQTRDPAAKENVPGPQGDEDEVLDYGDGDGSDQEAEVGAGTAASVSKVRFGAHH